MVKKSRYDVLPSSGGWIVKGGDAGESGVYLSKSKALGAARGQIEQNGGELRVHDKRGRVHATYTVGRENFEKISAVEGMRPTRDATCRAAEFERKGMTSEQRRRAIIEAHSTKA